MTPGQINPILTSACEVLREALDAEVHRGGLVLRGGVQPLRAVTAAAGLTGALQGSVLLSMSVETALAVAALLSGEEMAEFGDLAQAAVAELFRTICGRAVQRLEKSVGAIHVSPAGIFCGSDLQYSMIGEQILMIPLELPLGRIELGLALREHA